MDLSRRQFVSGVGLGVAGGLAGCGGDPPERQPTSTTRWESSSLSTTTRTPTTEPTTQVASRSVTVGGDASVRWSRELTDVLALTPAFGHLWLEVTAGPTEVLALDPADGSRVWRYGAGQLEGFRDGRIYVHRGHSRNWSAVDALTGVDQVAWSTPGRTVGTIPEGVLTARTPGTDGYDLPLALHDHDGNRRWRADLGDWADPYVDIARDDGLCLEVVERGRNEVVVVFLDLATGEERWRQRFRSNFWANEQQVVVPALDGDTTYLSIGTDPGVEFDPRVRRVEPDGTTTWETPMDHYELHAHWSDGDVVLVDVSRPVDGPETEEMVSRTVALDAETGGERWRAEGSLRTTSSNGFGEVVPTEVDGNLWLADGGEIGPLDPATGRRPWTLDLENEVTGDTGTWVQPEAGLLVASSGDNYAGFDPETGDARWRIRVTGANSYEIIDGVFYAKGETRLSAVDVGTGE